MSHASVSDVFRRVAIFAADLGWSRMLEIRREDMGLTWYESSEREDDLGLRLQINPHPHGQDITFNAIVYAFRYRLCSGWHTFDLSTSDEMIKADVERMRVWLQRSWYADRRKRRVFRKQHPECSGRTRSTTTGCEEYLRGLPFREQNEHPSSH